MYIKQLFPLLAPSVKSTDTLLCNNIPMPVGTSLRCIYMHTRDIYRCYVPDRIWRICEILVRHEQSAK